MLYSALHTNDSPPLRKTAANCRFWIPGTGVASYWGVKEDSMATGIVFAVIGVLGYWLIRVRRQRKTRLTPQVQ